MKHLFALLMVLTLVFPAAAQDDSSVLHCAQDDVEKVLTQANEFFDNSIDEIRASGVEETLSLFRGMSLVLSELSVQCYGLSFSSNEHGLLPVIGPVYIPAGVYRVTATTAGYMIVNVEVLTGECGEFGSVVNVSQGRATEGAQSVFRSGECEALIEVSNATEDWLLIFERVTQSN